MGEYLYQSSLKLQTQQGKASMLRGYDPLKEIYHWTLIIFLLIDEMVLVSLAYMPVNSISTLTGDAWNIPFWSFLSIIMLLAILSPFISFMRFQREKRRRDALRQEVPLGNSRLLAPIQPFAARPTFSLPIRLESQLKKDFVRGVIIGVPFFLAFLALDYIALSGNPWELPSFLTVFVYPLCALIPALVSGLGRAILTRVAGHYLHPSLEIDDEGINACYGRETISIAWQDVRYFALVNGKVWSKVVGKRGSPEREAFEISDGENMICWLATEPFSSYRLLWSSEATLSARDYTSLTQQLASLIVAKTDLPLLDFRLFKRKRNEPIQPHVFPMSPDVQHS